jgi:hypothetical protein
MEASMDIRIDPEFESWLRPLKNYEYERLKASIIKDGCRDPLVVWAGTRIQVDGHNRLKICTEVCEDYAIHEQNFEDRDDVLVWIYENQDGRRNLETIDKVIQAGKIRPVIERRAKVRMMAGTNQYSPKVNLPEGSTGQTRDALADDCGISGKTYDAYVKIARDGRQGSWPLSGEGT